MVSCKQGEVLARLTWLTPRCCSHPPAPLLSPPPPSLQTCEQRQVSHLQYLSWPDYGVPTSAVTLIDFLGAVKRQQRKMVKALGTQWSGHPLGPPMVVHCSAGIGRTGEWRRFTSRTLTSSCCLDGQMLYYCGQAEQKDTATALIHKPGSTVTFIIRQCFSVGCAAVFIVLKTAMLCGHFLKFFFKGI